jgi:hypothetical protein
LGILAKWDHNQWEASTRRQVDRGLVPGRGYDEVYIACVEGTRNTTRPRQTLVPTKDILILGAGGVHGGGQLEEIDATHRIFLPWILLSKSDNVAEILEAMGVGLEGPKVVLDVLLERASKD